MSHDFAAGFRNAAPYIRMHRESTAVVVFGGEAIRSRNFPSLVHDVALLHSLGMRLVLVAGSRPQIERRLKERDQAAKVHEGLRITDGPALRAAMEAAGENRITLEQRLTMALPGSPMAGNRVSVASGNFVTAQPVGVRDGIDYRATGSVRRIDTHAIEQRLDSGAIVILTPLGYSITGEAFNLSTPELASKTAQALGAEKLIALHEGKALGESELSLAAAAKKRVRGDLRLHLSAAIEAVKGGVSRAHLLSRKTDSALIYELFTREGVGTLIVAEPREKARPATPADVAGMLELLEPLEEGGQLVRRPREVLERDLEDFLVVARDGTILGCCALHELGEGAGELACLAVRPTHRTEGRGQALVSAIVEQAKAKGLSRLFVLTTQSAHWFVEQGFAPAKPSSLPKGRSYDRRRKSKVLERQL
ncbi:MAG: amino-acid N-acetyltransferase [Myxococcota bacterium]